MSTPIVRALPPPPFSGERNIEPPTAGRERSRLKVLEWIFWIFVVWPIAFWLIAFALWYIATGYKFDFLLGYGLGIYFGSRRFWTFMEKKGRIFKLVPSQEAVIITSDRVGTADSERAEASESAPSKAHILLEGLHVIGPFDQQFTSLSIEADYKILIFRFRVSLVDSDGEVKKREDMLVDGIATFETDQRNLFRLARISTDPNERKADLEAYLTPLVQKVIEIVAREEAKDADSMLSMVREIDRRINEELANAVRGDFYGVKLKGFTLGNIDYPDDVNKSRDVAAAIQTLQAAAGNLMSLNEGIPEGKRLAPKEALDTVMAGGKKETTRTEKSIDIDPRTVEALGSAVGKIIALFKS